MASETRAAVFAFVPQGRAISNKLHVRIGRCSIKKPVRDRFHGMNTPKVILLDAVVDDPGETIDQLKEIMRGFVPVAGDVCFARWFDFTECRYGNLWFETAYSLEALILFFEQIQKKFLGQDGDASAVRGRIEMERGTIEDVSANGDGALPAPDLASVPDQSRQFPLETALRVVAAQREQEERRVHLSVSRVLQNLELRARAVPGPTGNAS